MTDLLQVLLQKEMDIKRVRREIKALKFLLQKEMDIERVRGEIEALKLVIPMLVEDTLPVSAPVSPSRTVVQHGVPQSGRNGNGDAQGWP